MSYFTKSAVILLTVMIMSGCPPLRKTGLESRVQISHTSIPPEVLTVFKISFPDRQIIAAEFWFPTQHSINYRIKNQSEYGVFETNFEWFELEEPMRVEYREKILKVLQPPAGDPIRAD